MANNPEIIRTLVWTGLLFLFFRSLSACTSLFISINATVFFGSSIQVASGSKPGPPTTQNRSARRQSNRRDDRAIVASDRRRDSKCDVYVSSTATDVATVNTIPRASGDRQQKSTTSFNQNDHVVNDDERFSLSPKPKQNPSHGAIMQMYEEIIASDAETIQVQQAAITSQQEIIRSQREMIQKLQQLVEGQDAWIEEHLEGSDG